ncbi:MAG: hypothetical protein O3C43_00095 [Verrucomicrobia bacterium]|nr:hypothetical protein [Verrucomicrobiota bacterium]MDA1064881.1 hypothetical protein [Verrucomicrobiota bacterium]
MTNNLIVKTAALMIFISGLCSVQARVVITKEKQNDVLQTARKLLGTTPASSEFNPESLNDPFHLLVKEDPVEEVVAVEEEVAEVHEITDSEILALAAKQLRPSGFIDQGGQQYLILNGKKVEDGVSFNFIHEQKRYAIEINNIKNNSFTLNLNSESKTISME